LTPLPKDRVRQGNDCFMEFQSPMLVVEISSHNFKKLSVIGSSSA